MPAGFSKVWLQTYLREKMNFDGVIFSDDLSMQGAAFIGDFAARAKAAMHAGCDMVLVCNNPDAAAQVIDSLPSDTASNPRLARLAKVPCGDFNALKKSREYSSAQRKLAEYYD